MTRRSCSVAKCGRPHEARGYCGTHYQRWRNHGSPESARPTITERFWSKVDKNGPVPDHDPSLGRCWEWTDALATKGYGRFSIGGRAGRQEGAHRVAILLADGALPPEGMHTDHLCRNPPCVRRSHLEVVTPKVNLNRGIVAEVNRARQLSITHCPQGHAYDEENTHRKPNGSRSCRACARDYQRKRYAERKTE